MGVVVWVGVDVEVAVGVAVGHETVAGEFNLLIPLYGWV